MLAAAITIFILLTLLSVALHVSYVSRLRDGFSEVYDLLGRPSALPILGMFYLGDNNSLWRHLVLGNDSDSLPPSMQTLRKSIRLAIFLQYPAFLFLVAVILVQ